MRKLFFLIILVCSQIAQGQSLDQIYFSKQKLEKNNEVYAKQFLLEYFYDLHQHQIDLKLVFENETKASKHFTFELEYNNLLLLNSRVKMNTDIHGNILSIKRETQDISLLKNMNFIVETDAWNSINFKQFASKFLGELNGNQSEQLKLYAKQHEIIVALEIHQWNRSKDETIMLDIKGNEIFRFNHLKYLNKDTLVNIQIFNPDPLTSAGKNYGGVYVDSTDSNLVWMNTEYVPKTVLATFDDLNQTFYLENSLLKIDDFESPTFAPVTSANPSFIFNRNQSGFEDANVLYHITNFHDYIASLGYDTLMDVQLLADAHGQFNADNSVFNRNGGNPTISFGIGGVDDAEDADVIIHEYCHGVSWSANNNNTFNVERSGLDEGLADYFATSYSRGISLFQWANLFNWDGHNTFWNGRVANTTNNYPSSGNIYATGEIWNAAMSNIWFDLGQTITDKLMLEALHFFTEQTTLPQAALYVMQADTILFNGANANSICQRFRQKEIFNDNCRPIGIEETEQNNLIQISNTIAFSKGIAPAEILFPNNVSGKYELINAQGQKIKLAQFEQVSFINISPNELQSGIYILSIHFDDKIENLKLIKW